MQLEFYEKKIAFRRMSIFFRFRGCEYGLGGR